MKETLIRFIKKEGAGWIFLGCPFALIGTLFNVIRLCILESVTYKLESIVCSIVLSLVLSQFPAAFEGTSNKIEETGQFLFAFGLFMCVMAFLVPCIL